MSSMSYSRVGIAPVNASASGSAGAAADPREALLALLMEEERAAEPEPSGLGASLVPIQPRGSRAPLFCVGVFQFRRLAQHLGPDRPFYGLLGHAIDPETATTDGVELLAEHYTREIRSVQPTGPYHLCGFCFGGLVAYAMACRLRAQGERVGLLALIDAWNPAALEPEAVAPRAPWRERLAAHFRQVRREGVRYLARWGAGRLAFEALRLRVAFERTASRVLSRLGRPLPLWLNGAATFESDVAAAHAFRPEPYSGELTLIVGIDDDGPSALSDYGWRDLARGGLRIVPVPSKAHKDLLEEPRVRTLAAELRDALSRAESNPPEAGLAGVQRNEPGRGEPMGRRPASRLSRV